MPPKFRKTKVSDYPESNARYCKRWSPDEHYIVYRTIAHASMSANISIVARRAQKSLRVAGFNRTLCAVIGRVHLIMQQADFNH